MMEEDKSSLVSTAHLKQASNLLASVGPLAASRYDVSFKQLSLQWLTAIFLSETATCRLIQSEEILLGRRFRPLGGCSIVKS
jgi:hypothetical protein